MISHYKTSYITSYMIDGRTDRWIRPLLEMQGCNSTFLWCYLASLMTYRKKNLHFFYIKKTHYGRTDQPTDRRTDGPSYRDARTHLKRLVMGSWAHPWICQCNSVTEYTQERDTSSGIWRQAQDKEQVRKESARSDLIAHARDTEHARKRGSWAHAKRKHVQGKSAVFYRVPSAWYQRTLALLLLLFPSLVRILPSFLFN